ncbi:PRD domain-containing protein [Streptococcus thoraltensis]|uniref:PRD domain-containing protein n=1 Tax=Streptococcus thoraltensis TaxID=55085 RepID=UPI001F55E009|nr:PRD domain-containing protein [Streptococcus thoraltensis]
MYELIRSLNTNVALVKDTNNQQAVVMGLRVGFNKKKGDPIAAESIEKVFLLRNEESKENFLLLLRDTPLDFIKVSYDLIDHLIEEYHYPMQDYIYITLADHIFCSYQALQEGRYQRSQLPDMSEHYPIEYEMARKALAILKKEISNQFFEDEIDRIALHFLNAKGELINNRKDTDCKKAIMVAVESILTNAGYQRHQRNHNFYDRFMIHLTYLINRMYEGGFSGSTQLDFELVNYIRGRYHRAYILAIEILEQIESALQNKASQDEIIYLTIHLNKLL